MARALVTGDTHRSCPLPFSLSFTGLHHPRGERSRETQGGFDARGLRTDPRPAPRARLGLALGLAWGYDEARNSLADRWLPAARHAINS